MEDIEGAGRPRLTIVRDRAASSRHPKTTTAVTGQRSMPSPRLYFVPEGKLFLGRRVSQIAGSPDRYAKIFDHLEPVIQEEQADEPL